MRKGVIATKKIIVVLFIFFVAVFGIFSAKTAEETIEADVSGGDNPVEAGDIASSRDLIIPFGEQELIADGFTGDTYRVALVPHDDVYNVPVISNLTFEPGARSNWHSREGGHVLIATGGVGYYQEEGRPVQLIRKGDVVMVGTNVKYWHGAAPDRWFSHMTIDVNPDKPGVVWMEPVSDEEYKNLEATEYREREAGIGDIGDDPGDAFIFPKGEQMQSSDNFSGPVYLATIVGRDNELNCPWMTNVTFEPGVRNSWHMHGGGQILIVTGGTGYHQIKGEPVKILHPGDVAFCPPGETHWHGATASSWFAHIALGTNPGVGGMEWLNPITDEEYANLPVE